MAAHELHAACRAGDAAAARYLLRGQAEEAWEPGDSGWLPLQLAAASGHEAVACVLLDAAPEAARESDWNNLEQAALAPCSRGWP